MSDIKIEDGVLNEDGTINEEGMDLYCSALLLNTIMIPDAYRRAALLIEKGVAEVEAWKAVAIYEMCLNQQTFREQKAEHGDDYDYEGFAPKLYAKLSGQDKP